MTSKDFQKGIDALKCGDYPTALGQFALAAEQGHAEAQFNLGSMYEEGRGVPPDEKAAIRWYALAAKQGRADAKVNLAKIYKNEEDHLNG